MKRPLAFLFMTMTCVPAFAETCHVQISSHESHSSISQHIMVRVERAIEASHRLSPAAGEHHDVEFHLISAPSERRRDASAEDPFRLFFVLTDGHDKFLSADAIRCPEGPDSCVISVMRQIAEICGSMPNNSFKAKPLRGSP